MISLHSVLGVEIAGLLAKAYALVAILAIGIACVTGFVKGFRKVSWSGLVWACAGVAFVVIGKRFGGGTLMTLGIAAGCVLASMAGFGVLGLLVRPRAKWVKDEVNGDTSLAEYGLEFEPEYLDYDGENDVNPYGKIIEKRGFGKPNIIGRLLGAVACAINVGLIVWIVASVGLLAIDATSLKTLVIGQVLESAVAQKVLETAKSYAVDMLSLGIILGVAKKGYEEGLLNSIRNFLMSVGMFAVAVVGFYLPFSPYAGVDAGLTHFLFKLVERCTATVVGIGGLFGGSVGVALGKLFAGAVLTGVGAVFVFLLNYLLVKCCNFVSSARPTRMVDGCLATVLYLAIGAGVCVAIWAVLATLNYFGVLNIGEILGETTPLSSKLFNFAGGYVEKLLAPILGKLGSIGA